MKTADVRSAFLSYFQERDHRVVASDSLIPSTDPTLLFTSAGMVQFKPNFQNPDVSPYRRAASCQKCLRTSDIERVGTTLRHLTFFEMLGNFSFGDYFKSESIAWGWEFLTKVMGLPADRLIVTVFKSDDDAFSIWEKMISKDRLYRLGEDTNFWTMGPTGPCGPCSEILYDRGAEWSCGKRTCGPDCDCDRYLEIWNHVFTQFDRSADGTLKPLPRKNIDTGMGLERLSLLMQNVTSPFETDGFQAVFKHLAELTHRSVPPASKGPQAPTEEQTMFRRIADHSRAVTFMISDGILPSNEGRGYVLRRLLRQAARAGKILGLAEPFLYRLTADVVDTMQGAYPEIKQRRETIDSVVKIEEEKFLETLDTGTKKLEQIVVTARAAKQGVIPGDEIFRLYETYGFPFELTREMLSTHGISVEEAGFKEAQEKAAALARHAWKGSGTHDVDFYRTWKASLKETISFKGYTSLEVSTLVLSPMYRRHDGNNQVVKSLAAGEEGFVAIQETPFYPEGGGQVGDVGFFETTDGKAEVLDTQKPVEGLIVHRIKMVQGHLREGATVKARVDQGKREGTMRHHTATHMVHTALREVLGKQVTQAGSLVAPDRLRFDFNYHAPLTREQRQTVEDIVNAHVLNDLHVRACLMSKDKAMDLGAMMLFGEKYGENVRVVSVSEYDDCDHLAQAWSLELCGGTHVHATGEVGLFKIIGQSSVAAGMRRIEAVAGLPAIQAVRRMEQQLSSLGESLKAAPDEIIPRIERMLAQEKLLEKEISALKSSSMRSQFDDILKTAGSIGGIAYLSRRLEGIDEKQLREVADRLKDSGKLGVVVIAAVHEGKVSFVVSIEKSLLIKGLNAGQIAKELASQLQGSGGGRPDFAQGGGKNLEALDSALRDVENIVKRQMVK